MKIIHEKYPKKIPQSDKEKILSEQYSTAIKNDPSIRMFLGRYQEEITPIIALRLLEAMTSVECILTGIAAHKMSPCDLLWRVLPVPPVCIRPSIGQEGSRYDLNMSIILQAVFSHIYMHTVINTSDTN